MDEPNSDIDRPDAPGLTDETAADAPGLNDETAADAPGLNDGTAADADGWKRASPQLKRIGETIGDAACVVDASGRIRYANERYASLCGTDRDAVVGAPIERRSPAGLEERFGGRSDAAERTDSGVRTAECRLTGADGEEFAAEVRTGPLEFGDGIGGRIVVIRDREGTTERERELERRNGRLDRFAAAVTHDIRNSLTLAQGNLELLDERHHSEPLDAVADALGRMEEIVDDVLWLAREDRETVEAAPVSLRDTVENAWRTAAGDDESSTLRTVGDGLGVTVAADRTQFQRLLENVFSNAVDHGGGDVTVTVGRLDGGLYVEDDGPGIPADARDDVFELGRSTADSGTGLGLAIVRGIADAHGWSVAFTDGPTAGARFEIAGIDEIGRRSEESG